MPVPSNPWDRTDKDDASHPRHDKMRRGPDGRWYLPGNHDPDVQQAKGRMQAALRLMMEAERRHVENWELARGPNTDFAARRARIDARRLLDEAELARIDADEAIRHHQALVDNLMGPITVYWRGVHQGAVRELTKILLTLACEANARVLAIIKHAGDGVVLSAMTCIQELEATNIAFTCQKLLENAEVPT
jgi:hypothetical protein